MTDLAGIIAPGALLAYQVALSVNLSGFTFGIDGPALPACLGSGLKAIGSPARRTGANSAGTKHEAYGGILFEKIIVLPPTYALGFLLTERRWNTEIWNTHLAEARDLTNVAITGVGGLFLQGPASGTYYPGQSQIYAASLLMDGPANIANLVTWTFTNETAVTSTITGSRVMVFSPAMDWSDPFRETISFKTDVLQGYDQSEQRIALRTKPRYALAFRVTACIPLDTVQLEALLYGWQARVYGVPAWPEKVLLTSDLAVGGLVASGDFRSMPSFEAGGLCMVWTDQQHFEAFGVDAVSDTAIILGSSSLGTWPAGAWIVPLRRGRLSSDQPLGRPTNWTTSDVFSFTCEAVA